MDFRRQLDELLYRVRCREFHSRLHHLRAVCVPVECDGFGSYKTAINSNHGKRDSHEASRQPTELGHQRLDFSEVFERPTSDE